MNLSCLTCQGMKRTDSFADMERNMYNEKADNINKLLDGVDNRSWSGNLVARPNNNNNNSDDKVRNPTNFTSAAPKKTTNSTRRVPVHSSGPLTKTTTNTTTTTAVRGTRFARSSSSYSRPIPVSSSGPLTRTITTNATGSRLFGDDSSSSSSRRVPVHSSSGPLTLEGITAAATTTATATGPPKLVRCGGMRRDWSFEDLRQINSLKT